MATKREMSLDDFDFGFSIVDENELEAVTKVESKLQQTSTGAATAVAETKSIQAKMDKMYNAVIPLLNNLKRTQKKNTSIATILLDCPGLKLTSQKT